MLKFILALLTSMFVSSIATSIYYENKLQKQRHDAITESTDACWNAWERGYKIGHKHGEFGYPVSDEKEV